MSTEHMSAEGTLERAESGWRLRFERHLEHPREKVWRALVEPEHRNTWFPQQIVGDWRVGAPLRFVSEHGDFDGEVLAFEPESLVEFRWGTDIIRLELLAEHGGTRLTLVDTFEQQGKAARDAAGWHTCLDLLVAELNNEKPGWSSGERWRVVHPKYVEHFGPDAATIGPPPAAS